MKKIARIAATALETSGLLGALERIDRQENTLRVIFYHRIDWPENEPDLEPRLISATPDEFREHAELLHARYRVISIEHVLAAHRGEASLPDGAVLLTFDDAYADFAEHAWPILREHDLPAVLFVPTAFPDARGPGFWWDRLYAAITRAPARKLTVDALGSFEVDTVDQRRALYRVLGRYVKSQPHEHAMEWVERLLGELPEIPSLHRVLSWATLRRLAGEGLSICPHGHTHALCTRLSSIELAHDLEQSKHTLALELGELAGPPVMAYPANASDPSVRKIVRETGFDLAFGGRRAIAKLPFDDPFDITRLPAMRYGRALFRAQLRSSIANLGRVIIDRPHA